MPKGMQPIYTQTMASSSVATVTFNNIPQTFTDLKIVASIKTYNSVPPYQNDNTYMRFNGDSNTNYSTTIMYGNNATLNAGKNIAGNAAMYFGTTPTSVGSQYMWSNHEATILNYTTNNYKPIMANSTGATDISTTDLCYELDIAGLYRGNAPITKIEIGFANNFYIGTEFTLYGIGR